MTEADLSTAPLAEPSAVRTMVRNLVLAIVGFVCFAQLIYRFDQLGDYWQLPWLRFVGLPVAMVAIGWWSRRQGAGTAHATALGPVMAMLGIVLFFAVADWWQNRTQPQLLSFWTLDNLRTVAVQIPTTAVAALGMTMIIIAGGIDLSAGTSLSLSACVMALLLKHEQPIALAVAGCVLTGMAAGAVNGALISLLRVVPFIITLGTMTAYLGIGKILADETTIRPPLRSVPDWLSSLVRQFPRGSWEPHSEWLLHPYVPYFGWSVALTAALAILTAVLLHSTVLGRRLFAVGSNEQTARLCGINTSYVKILVYALAGLFVGVAGMLQFARLSSGSPTSGVGLELKIIAAVVIGGGSLNGGRGSVVGTLMGATMMQVIGSGCTALGLSNPTQDVIIGAIIITAVTLDQMRQRRLAAG